MSTITKKGDRAIMTRRETSTGNIVICKTQIEQDACGHEMMFLNHRELEMRHLMESKAKSYYQIITPFGKAYARSYGDSCKMKCAHDKMYESKKIQIINIKL